MKSGIGLTGKAITTSTQRATMLSSDATVDWSNPKNKAILDAMRGEFSEELHNREIPTKEQEIRDLRRMVDLLYGRYETTGDKWYLRTAERTRRKLQKEILDFGY